MKSSGRGIKIECPGCGAALIFDPSIKKMRCRNCEKTYDAGDNHHSKDSSGCEAEGVSQVLNDDKLKWEVYVCTSCGAELNINNTESSTYCAFCGQPTVIFDRIAKMRKPEYIIPFDVTKERACEIVDAKVKKSWFVSKSFKNIVPERVIGVYIPFWIYDIHYSARQDIEGEKGSGDDAITCLFYISAEHLYKNIPVDGSVRLQDELSRKLEPYDAKDIKDFHIDYLSGFYSDISDANPDSMDRIALERAHNMFDKETCDYVSREGKVSSVKVLNCWPEVTIEKKSYALFPAWFLTFNDKKSTYTFLVNGQTGKMVGGLPIAFSNLVLPFLGYSAVTVPLMSLLFYFLGSIYCLEDVAFVFVGIFIFSMIYFYFQLEGIKTSIFNSQSETLKRFSKDRQE